MYRITLFFLLFHLVGLQAMSQKILDPDSVVLITSLEKIDSLFNYEGEPYTGEAFFLKAETSLPMVMRSYVAGKQEGVWQTWYANGALYKEGHLRNGLEDGRYLEYFENGILCYEYFYDLGKKTGRWRSWHQNGDIYTERNFKDDRLHGRLTQYDADGMEVVTEDYENGRIIATTRNKRPAVKE